MMIVDRYRRLSRPAKASIWFFIARLMQRGISVLTTPIFTRILTTDEYGTFTAFNSWLELLGIFLTLRLSYGVFVQGLVRYDEDKDVYTSSLQGLTTLLIIFGLLIYLPFQSFFNNLTGLNTFMMLMIFLASWATAMFSFWSARQRVEYRYRALVIVTLLISITKPISGIIAVLSTDVYKAEVRVGTLVACEVLFCGWMFVYYQVRGRSFFNYRFWKHALLFNIPLIPHYLSQSVLSQSDRVMIRAMIGSSAAGVYGLAYNLSWMMSMINQSITSTLEPWLYQRIKKGETESIARVSYVMIILVGVANLCLIAIAPEAVAIFAPPEYAEAMYVVPPLAASVFLTFTYCLFAVFEFYYERTRLVMWASFVGAAVNLGLNWFLLPRCGYLVAGWTTLVGYAIYIIMHYIFMRRIQREEMEGIAVYDLRVLATLGILFGTIAAIVGICYPHPVIRYLLFAILLVACFVNRSQFASLIGQIRDKSNIDSD